ncbi:MAG: hypothetical protein PHE25_02120 [Candidatus Gracilibacteria bacterium]|nr:hypothetical protein [Candidatus Gracilibacteria bacterium]
MISFDKIVNKLLKKGGKVVLKDDIFEIIDPEKKPEYTTIVNKVIYRLKALNIIKTIRNGVYIIPDKDDLKLNEIDLVEKYYWQFVKKFISLEVGSEYFISGKKSLQIHLKDFMVPDKLIIINRKINKKVLIGNYQIIFKTISAGKTNLFSKLSKLTKSLNIDSLSFRFSNLELALIETSVISDNIEGLDINLISKAIKKYAKYFEVRNFYLIGELKYIMAFNRLKELSKNIDKDLYGVFLDIIKKNGGLFIGEGLRKGV